MSEHDEPIAEDHDDKPVRKRPHPGERRLIEPLRQAWKEIRPQVANAPRRAS